MIMVAGIGIFVTGLLEMEAGTDSGMVRLIIGAVFALMGSVMVREAYSKYRRLNRTGSEAGTCFDTVPGLPSVVRCLVQGQKCLSVRL